jgi:hypothetical protein
MNSDELEFAIFCIESIAEHLGINGREVYNLLTTNRNILDNYIVRCYNVLHTQGKEYIVNDILEVMRRDGVIE